MKGSITTFGMPTEIISGPGAHNKIPEFLIPGKNTLLVTDKGLADSDIVLKVTSVLNGAGFHVKVVSDITPNPDEETVNRLTAYLKEKSIFQVVALGGGSPLDAAKAACAMVTNEGPLEDYQWNNKSFTKPPLLLIVVPTTAGTGSEVTGVAVITSRNAKKGIKKREIFPEIAIIDPELMVSLPGFLTATTGMDALTHAVEAYVGKNTHPITDSLAVSAIRLIGGNLRKVVENGSDLQARENMAMASTLAGIAMDQAGLGIVHSLSGPVCSFMHLAHGLANAVLLPFGMEYNLSARYKRFAVIAELLGGDTGGMKEEDAAGLSLKLVHRLLDDIGLSGELEKVRQAFKERKDLHVFGESAADMFLIRNNPRPASAEECTELFSIIAGG